MASSAGSGNGGDQFTWNRDAEPWDPFDGAFDFTGGTNEEGEGEELPEDEGEE